MDEYHPDPKAAATIHDSGTELQNITKAPTTPPPHPATASSAQPKKSHSKLVAVIIAGLVLLGAAGALIWFLLWRNQPEVIAMDAVLNYLNAKTIRSSAGLSFRSKSTDDNNFAVFTFDVQASGLAHAGTGTVTIYQGDNNFGLTFKEAFTEDGELYFQIDHVNDTIESLSLNFDQSVRPILTAFADTIDLVDGTWWRVQLPELLDDFAEQLDSADRQQINSTYDCFLQAFTKAANDRTELMQLYREHPFVTISEYQGHQFDYTHHGKLYEVDFKAGELRSLLQSDLSKLTVYQDVHSCLSEAGIDLEQYLDQVETSLEFSDSLGLEGTLVLEIDGWSHRITGAYFAGTDDTTEYSGDLVITYPESIEIQTPADAQPASRLLTTFFTDFSKMLYTSVDDYTTSTN